MKTTEIFHLFSLISQYIHRIWIAGLNFVDVVRKKFWSFLKGGSHTGKEKIIDSDSW